jgi:transaldolase
MENKIKKQDLKEGFRVGEYFVTFPPGDFIHEDQDGNMSIDLDIYKIDKENAYKVNGQVTPELEQQISEELHKMLNAAIEYHQKNRGEDNV